MTDIEYMLDLLVVKVTFVKLIAMVDLWSPTDEVVVTNTVDIPVPNPGLMKTHWT